MQQDYSSVFLVTSAARELLSKLYRKTSFGKEGIAGSKIIDYVCGCGNTSMAFLYLAVRAWCGSIHAGPKFRSLCVRENSG